MPATLKEKTRLAQYFRKHPTVAEVQAWKALRRLRQPRFRRQAPVGPYVLDFYSPRWKLGIELDGPFHSPESDAERDAFLSARGIQILRYVVEKFNPDRMLREIEALFPGLA